MLFEATPLQLSIAFGLDCVTTITKMISLTLAPSSAALAGRSFTANSSHRSKLSTLNQRTHRNVTRANIVDAGYLLADAADKVADKANKVVGSVDAPGWVLPVS